jgi:hypothetical protein
MIVVLLIRFKESMYIQYSTVLYKNSPSYQIYKIELNGMTQLMCIHIVAYLMEGMSVVVEVDICK